MMFVLKQQSLADFVEDDYAFRKIKEDVLGLLLFLLTLLSLEEQHGDSFRLLIIK